MKMLRTVCIVVILLASPWRAQAAPDVVDYVNEISRSLESALEQRDLQALREALSRAVDYPGIARGVMGQHWAAASTEQQANFARVFQSSLEDLLSQALDGNERYEFEVLEAKKFGAKRAQVPVTVTSTGGGRFDLVFSLALNLDAWRVRNVIVSGVNLGLTYRNQFHELMKSQDGDIEQVIRRWRIDVNATDHVATAR